MAWVYLIIAGLFEVVGVIGLKRVSEKDNLLNNVILIGGFIASFSLLSTAMKEIPLSVAYAVWTGIGTLGSTVVGMLFFKESKSWIRLACILGIVFSVMGLKLVQ